MAHDSAVLVANAPLEWTARLATLVTEAETLLAADGGANHLARLGLRPSRVVGDLDSISDQTRAWLGEACLVRSPDQDRTDLEKALEFAFEELDLGSVIVIAALGGRPDHDLGNLGLLARLALGERIVFEGADHRALAVAGELTLASSPGETWSFWTFDPAVRVSITGVRWPVEDARIDAGSRPSISNEAVADRIRIRTQGGAVVVMRNFGSWKV
jgi:thiamine pyrophosphokinase